MKRLFTAHVQLVYEDERGETNVSSSVADRSEFWWNPKRPNEPSLWQSKIYLGEAFFNEIIRHPVPLDMNALRGSQAFAARTRSLPVGGHLPDLQPRCSGGGCPGGMLYRQFGVDPSQADDKCYNPAVPPRTSPRVEENQNGLAGTGVPHRTRSACTQSLGTLVLFPSTPWFRPSHQLDPPNSQANHLFPGRQRPFRSGLDFIP